MNYMQACILYFLTDGSPPHGFYITCFVLYQVGYTYKSGVQIDKLVGSVALDLQGGYFAYR